MPEANFTVTYWHIDSETDMPVVVKELLPHGYYGTITGAMQPALEADTPPVEKWLLSLVGAGVTLSVAVGDVVVWNGFAAQVMTRDAFDSKMGS